MNTARRCSTMGEVAGRLFVIALAGCTGMLGSTLGSTPTVRVVVEGGGRSMSVAEEPAPDSSGLTCSKDESSGRAQRPFNRKTTITAVTPGEMFAVEILICRKDKPTDPPIPCAGFPVDGDSFQIKPALVECFSGKSIYDGGYVKIQFKDKSVIYLAIPNRTAPIQGSDLGLGLTIVERWEEDPNEGFKVNSGVAAYYALSKFKTSNLRLISLIALVDFDPNIDLEVGLGMRVLLRPESWTASGGNGFGLGLGVGYNFMMAIPNQRSVHVRGLQLQRRQAEVDRGRGLRGDGELRQSS